MGEKLKFNLKLVVLLLFSLFWFLTPFVVNANSTPVDWSNVDETGNIEVIQKEEIDLKKELIFVELDGDYANVHVHYKFMNKGKDSKVKFGFPVDYSYGELTSKGVEDYFEEFETNLKILDGKKSLPITLEIEEEGEDLPPGFGSGRRWYFTEVDFPADEEKEITVKYRVKNSFTDKVWSYNFYTEYSNRKFHYDLSPSKNWGNGIVEDFKIIIDIRNEVERNTIIEEINLDGFSDYGGILVYEARDFDLAAHDKFEIIYDNSDFKLTEEIKRYRASKEDIEEINVSSTLADRYSKTNLFDGDFNTAWVEGKEDFGEGEWIKVEFKDSFRLDAIGIMNGYTKNKEIYEANNRIKKLKVEWKYASGEKEEKVIELEDKDFSDLDKDIFGSFMSKVVNKLDSRRERVRKVKLKILEVYEGNKYNDTCISELYLLGY